MLNGASVVRNSYYLHWITVFLTTGADEGFGVGAFGGLLRHSRAGGNPTETPAPAFAGVTFLRWGDGYLSWDDRVMANLPLA